MTTRRDLFTTVPALGLALAAPTPVTAAPCVPASPPRPQRARDPIVNHLGYRPGAAKHAVIAPADALDTAAIVRLTGGKPGEVARVRLQTVGGDFGPWKLADFSNVREPGVYRVSAPIELFTGDAHGADAWARGIVTTYSPDFTIGEDVHDAALAAMIDYYRVQACGASARGYGRPCHTQAIGRDDGGPARPITGGWHSACDHARDLPEIGHGAMGLLALAEARPDLAEREDVAREVRWGNDYFLTIQATDGEMPFGVYPRHYFELKDAWDTREYVLMTRPAPRYAQNMFIATQALIARAQARADPAYARRCLAAGGRCHDRWVNDPPRTIFDLGTAAFAAACLHRATGHPDHAAAARAHAARLISEQTPAGDWREVAARDPVDDPDYDLLNARGLYLAYAPVGLATVLEALPRDPDAPRWRAALARWQGFVTDFERANGFGVTPQLPYAPASAPRVRTREGRRFRYFLDTGATRLLCPGTRPIPWHTGHNGVVAGNGVALAMIARATGDREAARLAQRCWDWMLGVNPLDSTTILGFGRNNPTRYPPIDFTPPPPFIAGAGLQGFVGADDDQPVIIGGYYGTGEYWLPQHSWMLWLGALVSAHG